MMAPKWRAVCQDGGHAVLAAIDRKYVAERILGYATVAGRAQLGFRLHDIEVAGTPGSIKASMALGTYTVAEHGRTGRGPHPDLGVENRILVAGRVDGRGEVAHRRRRWFRSAYAVHNRWK
ncbi:MAG: hypothetical protein MZW92_11165 [Comamonadaceae bacterium]|nr:hypothetical protein [Comamonadaceae bacterium]